MYDVDVSAVGLRREKSMSDKLQPISMDELSAWIFGELETRRSIFGIPRELFFVPRKTDRFRSELYGHPLETPFGVAAGPHTQMAQNIVAAWLCGARLIELKTVQTLDELNVSKPCIDLQDEGYNVEWSQELKLHESFDEYLRAWVLIHALHRRLGFPGEAPGVIFNMSVGYNLDGLLKPNMQRFLKNMQNAPEEISEYMLTVERHCPQIRKAVVPGRLSNSVTLSTMHGCPPEEIEGLCEYLLKHWRLHTNVKLNPTLLGPDALRDVLNRRLGYRDIVVPDIAFEHDLKYKDAVPMLRNLRKLAREKKLQFGVKLSNTLEVENTRKAFDPKEKMMYMSGRALHAVTVQVARKLAVEFMGELPMSFSAGADAFHVESLLASGMNTITVCSDLLKSGGYLRLPQYIERVREGMAALEAADLKDYAIRYARSTSGAVPGNAAALLNLNRYAETVLNDRRLMKEACDTARTKTGRLLGWFDCIKAPCTDECPVNQQVPRYMRAVKQGQWRDAVEIVREDNPLPSVLGRACTHVCENACIRSHYDEPLAIREIKRFIMSHEKTAKASKATGDGTKVAVIGGGPCGLATSCFLTRAGYDVTVFEGRKYAGGMVSGTIPGYRATQAVIDQDLKALEAAGVKIVYGKKAGRDFTPARLRRDGFKYIVIATGAQQGLRMGVEGEKARGVLDGLEFLRAVREKKPPALGRVVGVIGGGDVAMDCARTAKRLTGKTVKVLYRRTAREMPAQKEEVRELLEEGIELIELTAPRSVVVRGGKMIALRCVRMTLGEPDESGRRRPVEVRDSEFEMPLDQLIVAIGQRADFDFLGDEAVKLNRGGYIEVNPVTMETSAPGVFAGGDAVLGGPETIVKALGDGRKIARAIRSREEPGWAELVGEEPAPRKLSAAETVDLLRRKAHREYRVPLVARPMGKRKDFKEILQTLEKEQAVAEASRCLECDLMCSLCMTVCPNRAIQVYRMEPVEVDLPKLRVQKGRIVEAGTQSFAIRQHFQVAVFADFCNECGNCATFCPTAGRPYQDKPRLYRKRSEFDAEKDNAFMAMRSRKGWKMLGRFGGETYEILMEGRHLSYTSPLFHAVFDPDTLVLQKKKLTRGVTDGYLSLDPCAAMVALLRGIRGSMTYLPTAE